MGALVGIECENCQPERERRPEKRGTSVRFAPVPGALPADEPGEHGFSAGGVSRPLRFVAVSDAEEPPEGPPCWNPWGYAGAHPTRGRYTHLQEVRPEHGDDVAKAGGASIGDFGCLAPRSSFLFGILLVLAGVTGIIKVKLQRPAAAPVRDGSVSYYSDPDCTLKPQSSWPEPKRLWCCNTYGRGCSTFQHALSLCKSGSDVEDWCCKTYKIRCAPAVTQAPALPPPDPEDDGEKEQAYDCKVPAQSSSWPAKMRAYCCQKEKLGCSASTAAATSAALTMRATPRPTVKVADLGRRDMQAPSALALPQ